MADKSKHIDPSPTPAAPLENGLSILGDFFSATANYLAGLSRYTADFMVPYLISTRYFQQVDATRMATASPADTLAAYLGLLNQNVELINRGVDGALEMVRRYTAAEMNDFMSAFYKSVWQLDAGDLERMARRQAQLMSQVTMAYPKAIAAIEDEYGFHFERGINPLVAETERFYLYQIIPTAIGIEVNPAAKPICIIPPYVLGANILGFLPGEQRSYAHSYANQSIPTYIRILKDIDTTEALQTMSGEDDARDTALFCRKIKARHSKPVTLNGYCQGGYNALCSLLSGVLDDLVDAFITCVAPMDGTRSQGLAGFLGKLPRRFNDLAYGTKTLANGNQVADGTLMGWVYKLKSIETESPVAAFYRDLIMFAGQKGGKIKVSKTAAALNYWLGNERNDLPMAITKISFASFNTPIAADGTLPVKLFDAPLNLNRIREKKVPWLICYGTHDDLVEKDCALAPLDYVDAEITPFPKGHVAIATSWSHPDSEYALHKRFSDNRYRGPVRFHLDLDATLDGARHEVSKAPRPLPAIPAPTDTETTSLKPAIKTPTARKTTPKSGPRANKKPSKHSPTTKKKAKPMAKATPAKNKKTQ